MLQFNLSHLPPDLQEAVRETKEELRFEERETGVTLLCAEDTCLHIRWTDENTVIVGYSRLCEFFRGVGLIPERLRNREELRETGAFDRFGYMASLSSGGAMNLKTIKRMMRTLALMGYQNFQLYVEDLLEIPGYPYLGYQRGRYTAAELKELVTYGKRFGLEVFPCIQTLGHLEKALRWDCFQNLRDTANTLYIGKEEVYEFLDRMLAVVEECFETPYVNIGMDEAEGIGKGRRLSREGYTETKVLMAGEPQRVAALCRKHHLQPAIWSDMFFCQCDSEGRYCSDSVTLTKEVIDSVPEDFTLIFWYYYNCAANDRDKAVFEHMMAEHQKFRNPIGFAGGVWKFSGLVPNNDYTVLAAEAHTESCLRHGIRNITVTGWGGSECSGFEALPGMLVYADRLYGRTGPIGTRFEELFGIPYEDYRLLEEVNRLPDAPPVSSKGNRAYANYLLYQDPLCGIYDSNITVDYTEHFRKTSEKLRAHTDDSRFGVYFDLMLSLSETLEDKAMLSILLRKAYLAGDREAMAGLLMRISRAIEKNEAFRKKFRAAYWKENRVFGLATTDRRLGAATARLKSVKALTERYLDGSLPRIEAWEEPVLDWECRTHIDQEDDSLQIHTYTYWELTAPNFTKL